MKGRTTHIAALLLCLAAVSCTKVRVDTAYTVRPWIEYRNNEREAYPEARVYGFDVSERDWTVATYEDAVNGIITNRGDGSKRNFTWQGTPGADADREFHFTSKPVMLVASTIEHAGDGGQGRAQEIFAYCDANIVENLDRMVLPVVFRPLLRNPDRSKSDTTYIQGRWTITNRATYVPVDCEYAITAKQVLVEGGDEQNVPGMIAYAFVGDTLDWKVASYEDARAGRLTSRTDEGVKLDYHTGPVVFRQNEERVVFNLTERDIIFVLCDPVQPMYGYGNANIQDNPATGSGKFTFRPYLPNETYTAENGKWVIVNGATTLSDPEEPEEP